MKTRLQSNYEYLRSKLINAYNAAERLQQTHAELLSNLKSWVWDSSTYKKLRNYEMFALSELSTFMLKEIHYRKTVFVYKVVKTGRIIQYNTATQADKEMVHTYDIGAIKPTSVWIDATDRLSKPTKITTKEF